MVFLQKVLHGPLSLTGVSFIKFKIKEKKKTRPFFDKGYIVKIFEVSYITLGSYLLAMPHFFILGYLFKDV